jgi:tRNA(fMet)-specific endonuclease VapC
MMIADTDVLIDFLAGRNPAADRIVHELEAGALMTTAITRFELLCGVRSHREELPVLQLLDSLTVLPLDKAAADRAAEVRRTLKRRGIDIGMGDSLTAGIVLHNNGIFLTRNNRHFERVEGLHLSLLANRP